MRRGYRDDPETGDFPGERVFGSKVDVKYVLQDATDRPDTLVVVFSAAPPAEQPPRYRWHKILSEFPCHRLFVLDDHGPREPLPRPNWYLGRHRSFDAADSICDLIDRTASELGVDRANVITVGSSMGGWAALYFGARAGAGDAVVGEPQTLLGSYLCGPAFHTLAEHIAGGSSPEDSDFLDAILFDAFRAAASPPHVHLLCGRESPYYERHVQPLVALLDDLEIGYELTLGENSEHNDMAIQFPPSLRGRLAGLLRRRSPQPVSARGQGGGGAS
jgi:pimeloyl-ACP methyl ester carboxylesterase